MLIASLEVKFAVPYSENDCKYMRKVTLNHSTQGEVHNSLFPKNGTVSLENENLEFDGGG